LNVRAVVVSLSLVWLAGCGGAPPWSGTYASAGTWDLSGPLSNGRTVGDSAADLLVERTVSLIGVPSLLEGRAQQALDALLRAPVKEVVDPRVPPELRPGGSVYLALSTTLAKVDVESELELEGGVLPRSLQGRETFTAFEYTFAGTPHRLDASALGKQGVLAGANWSGKEATATSLEIDPHAVELQFGTLVQLIVDQVADATKQTELKNSLVAALTCDQVVSRVSKGSGGLTLTVGDWTHTLTDQELRTACDGAAPIIRERVVGLFKVDSPVEVGGTATYTPSGELRSAPSFGGLVLVAPKAIAPRVGVAFVAGRKR